MPRVRLVTVPQMKPDEWVVVEAGTQLIDHMPAMRRRPVLKFNGEFLLRKDWPRTLEGEDRVEWFVDNPGDREDFRTVLQVAAIVAAVYPGTAFLAPYLAAASFAYNLLVPPATPPEQQAAQAVYNTSLSGNQARLDDPIWRTYGIDSFNPPFAGQPYFVFDDNNDQYYYAVFALGYGPFDLLASFIGKTPIGNFGDVVRAAYLKPGEQPTTALANVVTSREVTGLELTVGRYVGPFVVCQPGRKVTSVGWDVVAPYGLGRMPTDSLDTDLITAKWQIEFQEIDDAGSPVGEWRILTSQERTTSTNTPCRWSGQQDLDAPARVQVRAARANLKNLEATARDTIEWVGLKGFLDTPAPLHPDVSHYELVLRASQQLSAQSQTDFRVIAQAKVRTWNPDDGWNCAIGEWDNYVASRNPAWALADVWSDTGTGEGLPDERIDLAGLYALAQTADARQDRFDYTFTSRVDVWSASQLIASSCRARVFRRYGVRTMARDELATIGFNAITPRNVVPGSGMPMAEKLPSSTDPDGVIVEYVSNVTWDLAQIECPCPGVVEMVRPVYQRYDGIKGFTHAKREGLYHAADIALRQRKISAKTEMHALVASFLLPLRWLPEIADYGKAGDVAFWDGGTLAMSLTEQPDFSGGPLYLTLRRDDGSLTTPALVGPGPDAWSVTLPAAPDFDLVLDDASRERPTFILDIAARDEIVKVSSIRDGGRSNYGAQYFDIDAVVDDPRVHQVDLAFLPGPGDVQDPVGLPDDIPGGGTLVLVTLNDVYVHDGQVALGGGVGAGVRLNNDGTLQKLATTNDGPNPPEFVPGQWLLVPVEPAVAGLFEVFASTSADHASFAGDSFDTWLTLDTSRSWTSSIGGYASIPVLLQIRKVGDTVLQASRTAWLNVYDIFEGGGA